MEASTPLQAINQKELELRGQLHEARQRAEVSKQTARAEAEQMVARADQDGQVEADILYRTGMQQAQQEADAILVAARAKACALRRVAEARFDDAARQIADLVLSIDSPPSVAQDKANSVPRKTAS